MSQSPTSANTAAATDSASYSRHWDQLGDLIRIGRSFSGHERNCTFLNTGGPKFADVSAAVGFDQPEDGRCLALVDWDHDGDVDLWLANRNGPRIRFLRNNFNDAVAKHHFVSLRLVGTRCNRDAVGARVELHLGGAKPRTLIKSLRAGEGFLSQSSKWLHLGLGERPVIDRIRIRWPGSTEYEEIAGIEPDGRYLVEQGKGRAELVSPARPAVVLQPSDTVVPASSSRARVVLSSRLELPPLSYRVFDGSPRTLDASAQHPMLLNLWASWCAPCLSELKEFARSDKELRAKGITVMALCADAVASAQHQDLAAARTFLASARLPFPTAVATRELLQSFTQTQSQAVYQVREIPLPSSYLTDRQGRLAVLYFGPVMPQQVLEDRKLLDLPDGAIPSAAFAMRGRYGALSFPLTPVGFAQAFREGGDLDEATSQLRQFLDDPRTRAAVKSTQSDPRLAGLALRAYQLLASIEQEQHHWDTAAVVYREALQFFPAAVDLRTGLATAYWNQGNKDEARKRMSELSARPTDDPRMYRLVARAYQDMGLTQEALSVYRQAHERYKFDEDVHVGLAQALVSIGQVTEAIRHYREVLAKDPKSRSAANNLAWVLSTCHDSSLRNAAAALPLAEQLCRDTDFTEPAYLDTLAAAQAANERFEAAATTAQQAMRLAYATGQHELARRIKQRRSLYQARKSYVQHGDKVTRD